MPQPIDEMVGRVVGTVSVPLSDGCWGGGGVAPPNL